MKSSSPQSTEDALHILIVDDNQLEREVLQALLEVQGYQVSSASNGREAVQVYQTHRPDIILMDAMMPSMNGLQAARKIKQFAQLADHFIPIVFLTGLDNSEDLADCLEAGGDDFIVKPYNTTILNAKIQAFKRMQDMHNTVQQQRNTITKHHKQLLLEQKSAKIIFDNINHYGNLKAKHIRFHQSPYSLFSGDVLMGEVTPSGDHYIFLGDFTGHGLPAAMGAMPIADIFYNMTRENHSVENILRQMNDKLKTILPVDCFCCAAMLALQRNRKHITLWQGGLPDVYLLRGDHRAKRYVSNHLPLGILAPEDFKMASYNITVDSDDKLYLYSDGLLELQDTNGVMLGDQRLTAFFNQPTRPEHRFDNLLSLIENHAKSPSDDLTLIEVSLPKSHQKISNCPKQTLVFYYGVSALQRSSTLMMLIQGIESAIVVLKNQNTTWRTVIAELYNNALEHGILALSSNSKTHADGFSYYYQARYERLSNLRQGEITVTIDYQHHQDQHQLSLCVKDSGQGFDKKKPVNASALYGRGLPLLEQLCYSLCHNETGNQVTAILSWT